MERLSASDKRREKLSAKAAPLRGRGSTAAAAVLGATPEEQHAAVLRRDTPPLAILALARWQRSEPALLDAIASSRRWIVHYEIAQALCFNPRTPVRSALPLLQRLYPIDLVRALAQTRLVPAVRTAGRHLLETRLSTLTPGERLGLARNARGQAVAVLLERESDERVLGALLQNPALRELDVLRLISEPGTGSKVLGQVGRHPKWYGHPRVRAFLAQNPRTPPDLALALIESLPVQELPPIVEDPRISSLVRLIARRWLEEKRRQGPFAENRNAEGNRTQP